MNHNNSQLEIGYNWSVPRKATSAQEEETRHFNMGDFVENRPFIREQEVLLFPWLIYTFDSAILFPEVQSERLLQVLRVIQVIHSHSCHLVDNAPQSLDTRPFFQWGAECKRTQLKGNWIVSNVFTWSDSFRSRQLPERSIFGLFCVLSLRRFTSKIFLPFQQHFFCSSKFCLIVFVLKTPVGSYFHSLITY